jgi:hypothetical protein
MIKLKLSLVPVLVALVALGALAACTEGPSVAAHWKSSGTWGDGNCDHDYLWSETVHVVVSDATTTFADEERTCDDGGFDVPLPAGTVSVDVAVNAIIQQDQTHVTQAVHYTIAGPISAHFDLGTITIPSY